MAFKEIQDSFTQAQEKYYSRITNVNYFVNKLSDVIKECMAGSSNEVVLEDKVYYNEDTNTWDIKIFINIEPKNPASSICLLLKIPFSKSVEKINVGIKNIVAEIEIKIKEFISSDTFFVNHEKTLEYYI
jgi:hypothetical protein